MTEQKHPAPRPLSDEELEAATGGAVGFNPMLLFAAGAQGMYMPTAEAPPAPAPTGSNPLYVAPAEPEAATGGAMGINPALLYAAGAQGMYMPTAAPQPAPAPAPAPAPDPEPTVLVMPGATSVMGPSLNIASPISTKITLTGTVTDTGGTTVQPTSGPQPEALTFGTLQPTYTTITPTVRGVTLGDTTAEERIKAGGRLSPLEGAFDLGLVKT